MLRRIILVLLATIALSAGAARNAAAQNAAAPATYNWNGFYVGGHAGWGWTKFRLDSFVRTTNRLLSSGDELKWDGFLGGAQLGYNWMVQSNIVLGIEADLSVADLNTSINIESNNGIADKLYKLNTFGTVRGRVGYASNNWLLYGTGGFAWSRFSYNNVQVTCGPGNPFCLGAGLFNPEKLTSNLAGWTAGGGVEVGITPKWTAKLEYLYLDFGAFRQTGVIFDRRYDYTSLTTSVVRLGLNYRFGGT